jgi:hypothetical protein
MKVLLWHCMLTKHCQCIWVFGSTTPVVNLPDPSRPQNIPSHALLRFFANL